MITASALLRKVEQGIRVGIFALCELFTVYTFFRQLPQKQFSPLFLCAATLLLVALPVIVEKWWSCRIHTAVYVFGMLYAIGPLLGHCWGLYHSIDWWDKLLHLTGGVMFALFGLYLFERLQASNTKRVVLCALFAFCFSVTLSVLWEFVEFGIDRFTTADMQTDTVLTDLTSWYLTDENGGIGQIHGIEEVTINGQPLPVQGYLDIGLIDTVMDMLLETLGAAAVVILYWLDRGRHPLFAST